MQLTCQFKIPINIRFLFYSFLKPFQTETREVSSVSISFFMVQDVETKLKHYKKWSRICPILKV
jgi:hypothetical protein